MNQAINLRYIFDELNIRFYFDIEKYENDILLTSKITIKCQLSG